MPDFPKPGVLFKDIMPLLADPAAFAFAVDAALRALRGGRGGCHRGGRGRGLSVRGADGDSDAEAADPAPQAGQAAGRDRSFKYDLEYGSAELHVHENAIGKGAKVLLVDDVLATGGTMAAACRLVEQAGGIVVGCAFLIELAFLKGRTRWPRRDVFSLLTY